MCGSAAGAICALHGLKTLILDKNPRPGETARDMANGLV